MKFRKLQVSDGWLIIDWHIEPLILEWKLVSDFILVTISHFDPLTRHIVFQNTIVDCFPWFFLAETQRLVVVYFRERYLLPLTFLFFFCVWKVIYNVLFQAIVLSDGFI